MGHAIPFCRRSRATLLVHHHDAEHTSSESRTVYCSHIGALRRKARPAYVARVSERVWYFAYGANMSSRAFRQRLNMEPASAEAARLDNYAFAFDEPGIPLFEPAFASVSEHEGKVVHGVLYRMSADNFERLILCEGANYVIETLPVVGCDSGTVGARVFVAEHTVQGRRPSRRYLRLLIEGAREHGLPASWIVALEATRCHRVPIISELSEEAIARYMWLRQRGFRPEKVSVIARRLWARIAKRG